MFFANYSEPQYFCTSNSVLLSIGRIWSSTNDIHFTLILESNDNLDTDSQKLRKSMHCFNPRKFHRLILPPWLWNPPIINTDLGQIMKQNRPSVADSQYEASWFSTHSYWRIFEPRQPLFRLLYSGTKLLSPNHLLRLPLVYRLNSWQYIWLITVVKNSRWERCVS